MIKCEICKQEKNENAIANGICKGCNAVNFFSKYLTHTKGVWKGRPFELIEWQKKIIYDVFGTIKNNGYRQFNKVYIEVPKKNGKSELCAGVGIYLLFADKEPGAEIYSVAADRDQASIVFNSAIDMIRGSVELMKRCKILESTKRIIHNNGSMFRVLSSDSSRKSGYNIHGLLFDELHEQQNRELFDILTSGTGDARKQPLFFYITTAGYNRHSICWEVHQYAERVTSGIIKDESFYSVIYSAADDDQWDNVEVWRKTNPSLNYILDEDKIKAACEEAKKSIAQENNFRRFRLNQWVKQESRWLRLDKWDDCKYNIDWNDFRGLNCWAGLDLSSSIDITAFVLVFDKDDKYFIKPYFWIPKENALEREKKDKVPYLQWAGDGYIEMTDGNVIDYRIIENKIDQLQDMYNIQEIAYDRWGANQLSLSLQDRGFNLIPFGQGFVSMSAPTKEIEKLILQKNICHDGNPVLRWMIDNVTVKSDPAGNLKPDKEKSTEKIDGVVAAIMGLDRAMRNKFSSSVYEDRGILFL